MSELPGADQAQGYQEDGRGLGVRMHLEYHMVRHFKHGIKEMGVQGFRPFMRIA